MAESYKQAIQDAKQDIEDLKNGINGIKGSIDQLDASILAKLHQGFGKGPKELANRITELEAEIKKLNAEMGKQTKVAQNLQKAKEKLTITYQRQKLEEREAVKNAKLQAQATSRLVGAYNNLKAKRDIAKRDLRNLIASQKASTAEIKKAQREFDKYTARLNKANQATSNFSNTSLGGMVRGMNNLMGAFGIAGGLYLFADVARQGFKLAKQLDAIDFAMKTVITDSQELARTQAFLTDITERYGAELVTTTERYNKFLAAAKQSGVTLEDTELIFGTMTKAAGALGLRTHELEGVFLALEQMLSKGKVTTEELRRQLGERLPGAFGIMAQAVNNLNPDIEITVEDLDKMLKKGQVLSAEVLPEFSRQVSKAYGLENLQRVENLNAATTRLSNAWVKFVQDLTNSEGAINKGLVRIIDELSQRLAGVSEGFGKINHELEIANNSFQRITNYFENLSAESAVLNSALRGVAKGFEAIGFILSIKIWDVWAFIIKGIVTTLDSLATGLTQVITEFKEFTSLITDLGSIPEAWDRISESFVGVWQRAYGEVKRGVWEVDKELEDFFAKYSSLAPLAPDQEYWDFTKLGEGVGKANDELDENIEYVKGSVNWINAQIKALKEKRDNLATTTEAYRGINAEIEVFEEMLRQLEGPLEGSVAWLEEKIRLLKEDRDEMSLSNKAYEEATKKIEEYEAILKRITEGQEAVGEIKSQTFGDKLAEEEQENFDRMQEFLQRRIEEERKGAEVLEAIRTGSMENAISLTKEEFEIVSGYIDEQLERRKELEEGMKEFAFEAMDGIMERRVENIQREIEANRDKYAVILDNERLTEEERQAIEAERNAKERKLEKEKRKREREAFLINKAMAIADIAITLARTIAQINAAAAAMDSFYFWLGGAIGARYRATNIPMAIGSAAVQTGIVLAQALPQFKKGTMNAPEGLAIVDEVVPEVHTDKYGNVKSYGENKPNYRMLEQGDKIYKSREEYAKKTGGFNKGDLEKSILQMNMNSQGQELNRIEVDNALVAHGITSLKESNERVWREVKKLASRPINIKNTVEIEDKRPY